MDIDWNRAVLLPIDMQQGVRRSRHGRAGGIGQVDDNGLALLKQWRDSGRPIIHVRHDS